MSVQARNRYLKGVRKALENEVTHGRGLTDVLREMMQRERAAYDKARAAADVAEKNWLGSRQALLDAYSNIAVMHAKMGVIDEQLQQVEPGANRMASIMERVQGARDLGRALQGQPERVAHYAAIAAYEAMERGSRPSLSAIKHQIEKAIHGFSILFPDVDKGHAPEAPGS